MSNNLVVRDQLSLFGLPVNVNDNIVKKTRDKWIASHKQSSNNSDYGTFKDCLRAPVHRWFKYPAGYSYRLIEEKIKQYNLNKNHWVIDPFVGCGTTSVECQRHGINSIGIEAHHFVGWIAQTKLNWDVNLELVAQNYSKIIYGARSSLELVDMNLYDELKHKIVKLSKFRLEKGGKKSYDCMVAGYFSDMFKVLQHVYSVLKPGSDFILVLGDSAPYSVYIPTHEYLGRFGLAMGFSKMKLEKLRVRGEKWRNNPQRHKVMLTEVILTLTK